MQYFIQNVKEILCPSTLIEILYKFCGFRSIFKVEEHFKTVKKKK